MIKIQLLNRERIPEGHGVTWSKSKLWHSEENKFPVPGPPEDKWPQGSYTHGQQRDHPASPFRPAKELVIYREGCAQLPGSYWDKSKRIGSKRIWSLAEPLTSHPSHMCPGKGSHLCWPSAGPWALWRGKQASLDKRRKCFSVQKSILAELARQKVKTTE